MAILADPVRRATGAPPARRGVNYPLLGLAFLGLGIAKLATVYYEMTERIQQTPVAHEGCTRYESIMSPEDIIPVFEGVYVASSDERRKHMMTAYGVDASPQGELFAIWNVDTDGKDPSVAPIALEGFPEETAFHPHGLHFRRETSELFVINHAYAKGGERIDVFKVDETYPQDPLPKIDPSLEKPTSSSHISEGTTNAAEGDDVGDSRSIDESRDKAPHGNGGMASVGDAGIRRHSMKATDGAVGHAAGGEKSTAEEAEKEEEEEEEDPKEKANRLKREAKEEATRAKALAKEVQAAEKAAKKAAAARLAGRKKGLMSEAVPIRLSYSFSVEHDYITKNWGVLNDLVLVDDDELYVTQFFPTRFGEAGPTASTMSSIRLKLSILIMFLRVGRAPIIRCTDIRGENIKCERLAKGRAVMYNGIAVSPDKERLVVSDTLAMQMVVFNRSLETGALTLRERLDVPGSPDNLEMNLYRAAQGVEAYTVGLVHMWHFAKYQIVMSSAEDASAGDEARCAGGITSVTFDKESGKYSESLEMWQDGSLLQISSAAATASGARLVGSAMEEGFLLCRPPPCTPVGEGGEEHCGWGIPPSSSEPEHDNK